MSLDTSPAKHLLSVHIDLMDGSLDIRVDDVPYFGPDDRMETDTGKFLKVQANTMLGPGRNDVTVRFWPGKGGFMPESQLALRFADERPDASPQPFDDLPYAIQFALRPDAATGEYRLLVEEGSQPLLRAEMLSSAPEPLADGGYEVSLRLEVGVALPPWAWKSGQILPETPEIRAEVERMMRQTHTAIAQGPAAVTRELGPMLHRQAKSEGMTLQQVLDTRFKPIVDPAGIGAKLVPFDASESKLVLFGGGRLASLVPSPVMIEVEDSGAVGGPMLYYWRDASGSWHIWS